MATSWYTDFSPHQTHRSGRSSKRQRVPASALSPAIRTLGDKNVALSLAAAVALATLAARPGMGRASLADAVRSALAGAG
ncbi:MAG: hypothetical protein MOP51_1395 [Citricoccus sp.]|nr:hypothetical protein [Citricoccus sp. WCRC_4]